MKCFKAIISLLLLSLVASGSIQAVLPKKFYLISQTGKKFEVPGRFLIKHPTLQAFKKEFGPEGEGARSLSMSLFDDDTVQAVADVMNKLAKYPDFSKESVLKVLKNDLERMPVGEQVRVLEAMAYYAVEPPENLLSFLGLAKRAAIELGPSPSMEQLQKDYGRIKNPVWKKELARQYYLTHGKNLPAEFIDRESYGFSIRELMAHRKFDKKVKQGQLSLKDMRIKDLDGLQDIPGIETVTQLYLSKNQIRDLPQQAFNKFSQLELLFLAHNQLATISKGAFENLSNLNNLDLSDNKLADLPKGVFSKLSKLTILSLKNNQLSDPSELLNELSNLEWLELSGNPISDEIKNILKSKAPSRLVIEFNANSTNSNQHERDRIR